MSNWHSRHACVWQSENVKSGELLLVSCGMVSSCGWERGEQTVEVLLQEVFKGQTARVIGDLTMPACERRKAGLFKAPFTSCNSSWSAGKEQKQLVFPAPCTGWLALAGVGLVVTAPVSACSSGLGALGGTSGVRGGNLLPLPPSGQSQRSWLVARWLL